MTADNTESCDLQIGLTCKFLKTSTSHRIHVSSPQHSYSMALQWQAQHSNAPCLCWYTAISV